MAKIIASWPLIVIAVTPPASEERCLSGLALRQ
jgi:hypothetical protein